MLLQSKKNNKSSLKNPAFLVSALSLVISAQASAYEFEVGNTKASISGFIKLNAIYDIDNELGDVGVNQLVALDGEKEPTGVSNINARSSRIGFGTSTPVGDSTLKTLIEVDWADGARLRHAYGEWNGILAGQTWTNFGRPLGMTRVLDDLPQVGVLPTRQGQIRYTTGAFSVALEDPTKLGGAVVGIGGREHADAQNGLPDLTLNYMNKAGNLMYAMGGVVRSLSADSGTQDDTAIGWGVTLHGAYKVSPNVTLKGALTHGDGIGTYINNSPVAPAYLDPATGNVETIKATGGSVGIQLNMGRGQVNLGYGYVSGDLDDAMAAGIFPGPAARGAFETASDIHLNYLWTPEKNIMYGIEISQNSIKLHDGREGDAVRLQGTVQYNF